jgi:predicted SAM-dependent methyltransferase
MQRDGFINLTGIDPYIKNDITYRNGLKIFKKHIFELNGQYDLLMSHHSFEHMPQPLDVLNKFHELLKPTGYALIRIPVASSFAWRHYGVNWVGIDAPRHLFLHTLQSMHLLSRNAGFKMVDFEFDSTGHQFFASELYARNLSLNESSYYLNDPQKALFSDEQMEAFEEKARELNAKDDGDQACFYLQKV